MNESMLCTKTHEYLLEKNGSYEIGITEYAIEQLGDIVFIELPDVDTEFKKNEVFATVESVKAGLKIYDNPVGVLTNNPPFDRQLFRLNDYRALSPRLPENCFAPGLELKAYSFGMGTLGLPGDLTSTSRFVRAAFTRLHSVTEETEQASVSQFFHIMGTVSQTRGCCDTGEGGLEFTQYTSCCNADKGIYYYTTYENRQITAVDLRRENLDGSKLVSYPLIRQEQVRMMN